MSWPLVKLGDICETTQGVQITKANTKDEPYEGGFRYLYIADFLSDKKLSFVDNVFENKKVTPNDLVMANTGSPGRVFKGKEGILSNNLFKITFAQEVVNRDYLYLMLSSNVFQNVLQQQMKGGIQKHLGHQTISRQEIPLPPLDEQKRIAAILDKADAIRRKRQQAIQLADDFLRSVFLDMFGDPVTNPKGWEVKTVIDVSSSKLQNGAYYPKDMYNPAGTEMVHMGDAFYDYVPRGKMKRVLVPDKDLQKYCLTSNDILISRRSLNYEGAAKPSLISESEDNLIFESSLIRLSPDQNIIDKLYLFSYLSNEKVKKHKVRQYVTGATIKGISQKNLEKVNIVLPPLDLQKKYAQVFRKVETLKNSFSYYEQNKLFESLSQKAFAGEL